MGCKWLFFCHGGWGRFWGDWTPPLNISPQPLTTWATSGGWVANGLGCWIMNLICESDSLTALGLLEEGVSHTHQIQTWAQRTSQDEDQSGEREIYQDTSAKERKKSNPHWEGEWNCLKGFYSETDQACLEKFFTEKIQHSTKPMVWSGPCN